MKNSNYDELYFIQIFDMNDFFTPIQVFNEIPHSDDAYQIDKYNTDPFMPTSISQESLGEHRKKIIQWLKNMPIQCRINKLTYTNKQFACLLISMFQKIEEKERDTLRQFAITFLPNQGFTITQERLNRKPNQKLLQAEYNLIKSILIVNRFSRFDSVTLDSSLASDINRLFQLFDTIQNGISYELTTCNYQNYINQGSSHLVFYNPLDYDCSITKSLGSWLVEAIKKNLCIQYFKQTKNIIDQKQSNRIQPSLREYKNDIYQTLKLKQKTFKKYWKSQTTQHKQKLLQKIFKRDIRNLLGQYRQIIHINGKDFPKIIYSYPEEIQQFIHELSVKNGQNLFSQLTYTNLSQVSFQIGLYKFQIMMEIELEIEKKKLQQNLGLKKKFSKLIKNNKEIKNKKNFILEQSMEIKKKQNIHKETIKKNQSVSTTSILSICGDKNKAKNKKKRKNKEVQIEAKNIESSFEGSKKSETTNDQDDRQMQLQLQKYRQYEQEHDQNQHQLTQRKNKKQFEGQFSKVLKQFDQKISKWNKYQQIALNRIASTLYLYNLSYQLFGSSANGLAISSSDLDICIDPTIIHYFYGSFCSYREKVILALKFLQSCFEQTSWTSNTNLITTASVPLLVLQIDLGIPYGDIKNQYFNIAKTKKNTKIYVDITIQPFANMQKQFAPHMGYESTAMVRQWLREYKELQQMIRIIKHIFQRKNLNKSFTGGISSYALTCVIYAFMKNNPENKQKQLLELLIQFCDFYSKFDEKSTKIQVFNNCPYQKCQSDKLIVQNYFNGKNLTENCYKLEEIKQVLGQVKQILSNHSSKIEKQYVKDLKNLLLQ